MPEPASFRFACYSPGTREETPMELFTERYGLLASIDPRNTPLFGRCLPATWGLYNPRQRMQGNNTSSKELAMESKTVFGHLALRFAVHPENLARSEAHTSELQSL